jgi:hypothetical protein
LDQRVFHADPDPAYYHNADSDPDAGSQPNAIQITHRQSFKKQKVEFSMKIILEVAIRSKNIPYEGTKAFLKGKKPGLFVNWSTSMLLDSYPDPHY